MKQHEWRENTEEGGVRLVRVTQNAGTWKLQSKLKSDTEWTRIPVIPLEDLETLLEVLSNKYRRNRIPHDHVLQVEALIKLARLRRPGSPPPSVDATAQTAEDTQE
jgi:hypothetical protein